MTGAGIAAGPRFDHYDWRTKDRGGREAMLRFGPQDGPVVIVAPPLFEEANRTRALIVAILRDLADRRIGGVLPDLPGQGDSVTRLETLSFLDLRQGHDGVVDAVRRAGGIAYGVGIRSGALLDTSQLLRGRWYLAPQDGPDLLRELRRIKQATMPGRLSEDWYVTTGLADDAAAPPVEIAGNMMSTALVAGLGSTHFHTPQTASIVRVVRLVGDAAAADRHLAGPALWRRSEPGVDLDLAAILADDIAHWIARCEG